jgi:hypothetical protein
MAQESNKRGRQKTVGSTTVSYDASLENAARAEFLMDPMSSYYRDNFELLRWDTWLSHVITLFSHKLLSKGFAFILDDGRICKPTGEFNTIIENFWISFFYRMIRFSFCTGYLVWYRRRMPQGFEVPAVPDWRRIKVDHDYDKPSGGEVIMAKWLDKDTTSQLYVCHHTYFTGISPGFRGAPIDSVKPLLFTMYQINESRLLMYKRLAQPDIILSDAKRQPRGGTQPDSLENTDAIDQFLTDHADQMGEDESMYERVDNAKSFAAIDVNEFLKPVPPTLRTQIRMLEPVEERYHGVPAGLSASLAEARVPDLDYVNTRAALRAELLAMFEVSEGSAPGPGGGAAGPTGGESRAIGSDTDTVYAWKELIRKVATDVFRVLYNAENIQVGGTQATYAEQKRRVVEPAGDRGLPFDDMFETPAPPRKRAKREPAAAPEEEPKVVEMLLYSHVIAHRDMAHALMEQGGISEDTYLDMHPPGPAAEAEAARKQKDKETALARKDKEKEAAAAKEEKEKEATAAKEKEEREAAATKQKEAREAATVKRQEEREDTAVKRQEEREEAATKKQEDREAAVAATAEKFDKRLAQIEKLLKALTKTVEAQADDL